MTLAHDELTAYLSDHILASLVTAAIGDAMGAASEQHTIGEVVARYGGLLKEFHAPSTETFSHGNLAGQITDDCSQMFLLAQLLIDCDGIFPEASWIAALVEWSQTSPHRNQMGPTSRPLLEAIANGQDTTMIGCNPISKRRLTTFGATNGAAMRIAPVGLIWPGNIERAVELAWQTCRPTHNTQIAAAGAGAIAAGVSNALESDAGVWSVVRACLDGARMGEIIGLREGRNVPGPNIARRIELAVEEALRARDLLDAIYRIEATVGTSVMMADSVPAAIGLFVAANGDPLATVSAGATIGNDSDTIASMAGSLAGALSGMETVPTNLFAQVKSANIEDIESLASGLTLICTSRLSFASNAAQINRS